MASKNGMLVLVDSDTALQKIEPLVAAATRGIHFGQRVVIGSPELEERALALLRDLGQRYHLRVTVRDTPAREILENIARYAMVGGVVGLVLFVFTPAPFATIPCLATLGAVAAVVSVTIERRDDGALVFSF